MKEIDQLKTPDLTHLRSELLAYTLGKQALVKQRHPVEEKLDAYDRAHPGLNAYQLKAAQYAILAENMETKVFSESPFFFVNDLCRGLQAGLGDYSAGGWLQRRNKHLCRDVDPEAYRQYEAM